MSLESAGKGHKSQSCRNLSVCWTCDHSLSEFAKSSKVQLISSFPNRSTLCFALAAVDTRQSHRQVHALDGEERKHDDFTNLVSAALHKAGSKKALLPTKSKKTINEVNLRDLTRSKRQFVVEEALEVKFTDNVYCPLWRSIRSESCQPRFGLTNHASHRPPHHDVCPPRSMHKHLHPASPMEDDG